MFLALDLEDVRMNFYHIRNLSISFFMQSSKVRRLKINFNKVEFRVAPKVELRDHHGKNWLSAWRADKIHRLKYHDLNLLTSLQQSKVKGFL